MASLTTSEQTVTSEQTKKNVTLSNEFISAIQSESANFTSKNAFRKAFEKMLKETWRPNEDEYASKNQCDLDKELTRIAYVYEKSRIVAIEMTYSNNGKLSFGASIFKREGDEIFGKLQKNNIRSTAMLRHKKNPVELTMDVDKIGYDSRKRLHFNKIIKFVRKHVGSHGVKCKQSAEPSTENNVTKIAAASVVTTC
jgi:hypothetical protein